MPTGLLSCFAGILWFLASYCRPALPAITNRKTSDLRGAAFRAMYRPAVGFSYVRLSVASSIYIVFQFRCTNKRYIVFDDVVIFLIWI